MPKRILLLLIPIILLSASFAPLVLAASTTQNPEEKVVVLPKDQTVNRNYFAAGHSVTLSGTVNGDAYIAGGNVLVDGVVNGDLLVAGGDVVVRGTVTQNIRAAGGTVEIAGIVGRDVSVAGGNVTIDQSAKVNGSLVSAGGNISVLSPITENIDVAGSELTIANTVNGDVRAATSKLTFSPSASVSGNVSYWSDANADMQSGSQIAGSIKHFTAPGFQTSQKNHILQAAAIWGKLFTFAIYVLLGLFFVFFFPQFSANAAGLIRTRFWATFGWGALITVLSPFFVIVLFLTVLGIPFAFLYIFWFFLAAFISKVFVAFAIGEFVMKQAKTKMHVAWMYILGLLIYEILKFIPIIGGIVSLLAFFAGMGSLVLEKKRLYSVLRKEKYI